MSEKRKKKEKRMSGLTGVQPTQLQNNPDITRLLIAKLNSIRRQSIGDGRIIRPEIQKHLRETLKSRDWTIHGETPIIAAIKNDHGDAELRSQIGKLMADEEQWALKQELIVQDHPGFQWAIFKPINEHQEDFDLSALFQNDQR